MQKAKLSVFYLMNFEEQTYLFVSFNQRFNLPSSSIFLAESKSKKKEIFSSVKFGQTIKDYLIVLQKLVFRKNSYWFGAFELHDIFWRVKAKLK